MIQKIPDLGMHVEVMGCPTTCQHCWAVGRSYQAMPLEDITWVLQEVRCFCDAHDLTVDGYPMHEVAAHPQASQVMKLFHDLLEASGYNIVQTRNGLEAIDLARSHRPDLILMDIQLPEISGLEVTKWIKEDDDLRAIGLGKGAAHREHGGCQTQQKQRRKATHGQTGLSSWA